MGSVLNLASSSHHILTLYPRSLAQTLFDFKPVRRIYTLQYINILLIQVEKARFLMKNNLVFLPLFQNKDISVLILDIISV